jgi:hypothetical protein
MTLMRHGNQVLSLGDCALKLTLGHVQPLDRKLSIEPRAARTDRRTDKSYSP